MRQLRVPTAHINIHPELQTRTFFVLQRCPRQYCTENGGGKSFKEQWEPFVRSFFVSGCVETPKVWRAKSCNLCGVVEKFLSFISWHKLLTAELWLACFPIKISIETFSSHAWVGRDKILSIFFRKQEPFDVATTPKSPLHQLENSSKAGKFPGIFQLPPKCFSPSCT